MIRWGKIRHRWPLQSNLARPAQCGKYFSVGRDGGGRRRFCFRHSPRAVPILAASSIGWNSCERLRGVRYINDSKATNVDSTRVALASFSDPLIVILGGEGKGSPYAPLKPLIARSTRSGFFLIGEDAPKIAKELKGVVPMEKLRPSGQSGAPGLAFWPSRATWFSCLRPAPLLISTAITKSAGRHFKSLVGKLRCEAKAADVARPAALGRHAAAFGARALSWFFRPAPIWRRNAMARPIFLFAKNFLWDSLGLGRFFCLHAAGLSPAGKNLPYVLLSIAFALFGGRAGNRARGQRSPALDSSWVL